MAPRVLYGIDDAVWLAVAYQSQTLKQVIEAVGVCKYTTWMNLAKLHRPDLVQEMRQRLVVSRRQEQLPRCECEGCTRPVKARRMCKQDYENWLKGASSAEKIRRSSYPPDDQIVAWFEADYSMARVARRIGVARETLRDYVERRPTLALRVEPLKRLPVETLEARNRAASMRWRRQNPDRVRTINRRWARNQDPAARRRWNSYNRVRRLRSAASLTASEVAHTVSYQRLIRLDPCVYCGGVAPTVDHIRPIRSGGDDRWDNQAPACRSCNSQKNDKQLLVYLLWRTEHADPQFRGGVANPV